MAINKKLIHFKNKSTFNSKKLSANEANTQYQVGGTGTVTTGAPDINYQSIVYIKDTKEVWTHGTFYSGTTGSSAWADITGKPSWIGSSKPTYTWSEITSKPNFATVATSGSYNDLSNKPTIPSQYTLPAASTSALGGIKLTSSTKAGTPHGISTAANRTYAVQLTNNNEAVVNVPWTDTTSSYTLPTASSSTLGGIKVGSGLSISNGVLSSPNPNQISSRKSYVRCDTSSDDISLFSPKVITLNTTTTTITSTNTIFNGGEDVTFNNSGTLNVNCDAILTEHLTIGGVDGPERRTLYLHGDLVQDGGDASFTGTVSADGGFFDTSDARVKTNVRELNAINADTIKLVEFDRTDIEHHGYGVIAQEVEKVYPSVVNTDADGFKSVNYNEIAMIKIKSLEDKVARLEDLVARLESKLS